VKKRTNEEWLSELRGSKQDRVIGDLRAVIVRGLKVTFAGRVRDLNETVEDLAQDALIRVLNNLDSFRGESRFTTWAQRIAVRVAYTELRRRRWRDVSLQEVIERHEGGGREPPALADRASSPERETAREMMSTRRSSTLCAPREDGCRSGSSGPGCAGFYSRIEVQANRDVYAEDGEHARFVKTIHVWIPEESYLPRRRT
jgi:RNA polymerase sigma factor (sigma-70 family)